MDSHYVPTSEIKPGNIVAEDVLFNDTNATLVSRNTVVTPVIIQGLLRNGINGIRIKNQYITYADSPVSVAIQEKIMQQLSNVQISNGIIQVDKILDSAETIVDSFLEAKNVSFEMMSRMTGKNELRHALNVCEFAVAIGKKQKLARNELVELATAALMHDFGKMCINEKVLSTISIDKISKYKLTFVKMADVKYSYINHTIFGACLVDGIVKPRVVNSILYHQKEDNNTGIPIGMPYDTKKTSGFDRIIHVCDLYDNFLNQIEMQGRKKVDIKSPFDAYILLSKEVASKRLSIENYNLFVDAIPIYPKGIICELSDGRQGKVVYNLAENALYPVLKLDDNSILNLLNEDNRSITIIATKINDELDMEYTEEATKNKK